MKISICLTRTLLLGLLLSVSIVGCSKKQPSRQYVGNQMIADAPVVEMGYVNPSNLPVATGKMNRIRRQAIENSATTLGATGALAWRSRQINASLKTNAEKLTMVFDFNQLMLPHNVAPPVLVEANNTLNTSSADTIRLASKSYRIEKQAHFITTPPTWRDYLWLDFKKPEIPDSSLLPRDQNEANLWNACLKKGWHEGIEQANAIFNANLNSLKRDYAGMILYRKLLAENIVSAPFVAKANLGVTGDHKEIRINDQILRITSHSELQPDSSQWNAVITKGYQQVDQQQPAAGSGVDMNGSANLNQSVASSITTSQGVYK